MTMIKEEFISTKYGKYACIQGNDNYHRIACEIQRFPREIRTFISLWHHNRKYHWMSGIKKTSSFINSVNLLIINSIATLVFGIAEINHL